MKKIIFCYLILSIFYISGACNKKNEQKEISFNKFPKEANLKGFTPNMEILPLKLHQIEIIDSLIVAFDFYNNNQRLYIFNANNFNLIESAGIIGEGPKELTRPFFFDIDRKTEMIWIGDRGKQKNFGFHIDSIIQSGKKLPDLEVKFPEKLKNFTRIRVYNDSLFALTSYLPENKPKLLKLINTNGKIIDSLGNFPQKRKKEEPKYGYKQLWEHNMRIIDNKNIIISFLHFDKIMLLDSSGNNIYIASGPDKINPKRNFYNNKSFMTTKNTKRGYGPCYKHKEYILCLYSGNSFFTKKGYSIKQQYFEHIHVFDEEGNPFIRYNLSHEIRDFIIDENNKRIIGISTNTPEPFIIFPLSKIE